MAIFFADEQKETEKRTKRQTEGRYKETERQTDRPKTLCPQTIDAGYKNQDLYIKSRINVRRSKIGKNLTIVVFENKWNMNSGYYMK